MHLPLSLTNFLDLPETLLEVRSSSSHVDRHAMLTHLVRKRLESLRDTLNKRDERSVIRGIKDQIRLSAMTRFSLTIALDIP